MNILAKIKNVAITKGYRVVRSKWGNNVVENSKLVTPYGMDVNPVQDTIVVTAKTQSNEDGIAIGFLNKKTFEDLVLGEIGFFSENSDKEIQANIIFRNEGTLEINGNDDYMVRFSKLEESFNELQDKYNKLVDAFNSHVHPTAASGPPSTPTPIPDFIPASNSTTDIAECKIENIKTNKG